MKRSLRIALTLLLALCAVVVAACGGSDDSSSYGLEEHGQRRPDAGKRPDLRDGDP